MLSPIFERFVEKSPVSVMVRGLLERVVGADKLDAFFYRVAHKQYTRTLLFSTLFDLMCNVVCGIRPSIHATYTASVEDIGVSVTAVYDKLNGLELHTASALVKESARELKPLMEEMGGGLEPLLPGYRIKILDGNCLGATQHRIKELREIQGGALPGKSLVVLDPAWMLATHVFPCEDGHAQERSLVEEVLWTVEPGDVWISDRNLCTRRLAFGVARRNAYFIIRHHQQVSFKALDPLREVGRTDTGMVSEQKVEITDEQGQEHVLRRIRIELDEPTSDGDEEIFILTNLPQEVADAKTVACLYRKRWTIEGAFQELAENLCSEINTLGYPKAALFGFCVALVAYNVLSTVKAALRSVHGTEKVEKEISGYYLALEISGIYQGMMIAIPEVHWSLFSRLGIPQLAELMIQLAGKVRLSAFKKHPRGPKKKTPQRNKKLKQSHVSTAKLLGVR
ncbi:MAG: transposase [Planctomycetota bacterium]|jgi:hypothetical protein|nr:transposase [Planctomycetota bacterium]